MIHDVVLDSEQAPALSATLTHSLGYIKQVLQDIPLYAHACVHQHCFCIAVIVVHLIQLRGCDGPVHDRSGY